MNMHAVCSGLGKNNEIIDLDKSSKLIILAVVITLILGNGSSLLSRFLSNLSARSLPEISKTIDDYQELNVHSYNDIYKWIRDYSLILDKNNLSAQLQSFRWMRYENELYSAANLIPYVDKYDYIEELPDYPLIRATYLTTINSWKEANKYYWLWFTERRPSDINFVRSSYYNSLAHEILESGRDEEIIRRYKAGKLYFLSDNHEIALKEAMWIERTQSDNQKINSWSELVQGISFLSNHNLEKGTSALTQSIQSTKNPLAAKLLLSISYDDNDIELLNYVKTHLMTYEPDWTLIKIDKMCTSQWELAGYDIDKDILEAGLEVYLDLYWFPRCGEDAREYGLIDTGKYWIEPNYVAENGFANPSFNWTISSNIPGYYPSSPNCCKIFTLGKTNYSLSIKESDLPATRAVTQQNPSLAENSYFLVGGEIKWGDVSIIGKSVTAVIGGFWLDKSDNRVSGYNNAVNDLQEFILIQTNSSNDNGESGWLQKAAVVRRPVDAVKYSPWIGLTSSSAGTAEVFFDNLFFVPLNFPSATNN